MSLATKLRAGFARITGRTDRAMVEMAAVIQRTCRETVGVQGDEHDRSAVGEAPRRQTGAGQASIKCVYDRSRKIITLSSNWYMQYHERLRPWRDIALARCKPLIDGIRSRLR